MNLMVRGSRERHVMFHDNITKRSNQDLNVVAKLGYNLTHEITTPDDADGQTKSRRKKSKMTRIHSKI